jgi:hypothetical protein
MAAHKDSGGGDKHWRLSPKAMMDLKAIIDNSPKPITEQSVIEGLLATERKGTFLRLSRRGLDNLRYIRLAQGMTRTEVQVIEDLLKAERKRLESSPP